MKSILLYLDDELYEKVTEYAKTHKISIVSVISELLKQYFETANRG